MTSSKIKADKEIKNFSKDMEYRRFGRTEAMISVITLGGMRYDKAWAKPREEDPFTKTIEHCRENVELALATGINHIETAYGYGQSERVYGEVLNKILKVKREDYLFMTKGWPKTGDEAKKMVEEQLKVTGMDYFDFYAWHGINNQERLDLILKQSSSKNGFKDSPSDSPLDALEKMKEEGIIKAIGFSTHGPLEIILKAIATDRFDFVNLHYYYFFQRNWAAVQLAEIHDMGVFIISPNDKGGQLFSPYPELRSLTSPYTPIQFNANFCLSTPAVQTLSFGMTEKEHYQEMQGIFPTSTNSMPTNKKIREIKIGLDKQNLTDYYSDYLGYGILNDPSGINIPEILRFRKLWKCYGMEEYVYYRYNMLESEGHWFPGKFASEENLAKLDTSKLPENIPVKEMLREVHKKFYQPKKK